MFRKIKKLYDLLTTLFVVAVIALVVLLVGVRAFGLKPYTVLSGSMEPKYHVGSVIYVGEADPKELSVGDPLTFTVNGTVVTHQIIEITDAENPRDMTFVTQGLTNNVPDGRITVQNIIGKPVFSIPYLGYVSSFLQNPMGIIGVVGVLVMLLLISFILDLFADGDKGKKLPDASSVLTDSHSDPDESAEDDIKNIKEEEKQ